ncbi:MmgE/PrpD family protein [Acinetobacter sp. B10A]|uniref:MmgE/PrpD family protein n=1 Tax=Acinetobacter baretiae TaxID=2605383 RepID=UPI001B3C8FCE|nr:MmgE/PrpD family protein [Acinetobacter baretiae]MBF7685407.1 MmgE/PrpD family protein [Acinetobacter baretiae]
MQDLTINVAQSIVHTQVTDYARLAAKDGVKDFFAVTYPVMKGLIPDTSWQKIKYVYPHHDMASFALKTAYAGHALDYDDFHADFRGHPTVVILPVLFALLEVKTLSSVSEFLDAYTIGVEVAGRLGLAISQQHYAKGFHATSSLGIIAATAAMARLCRFDVQQTANALGLACTLSSGLRAQFGTAIKPLHAGFVAQKTIEIYQLVSANIQGQTHRVLDAFLNAYSDSKALQPDQFIQSWGQPFRIVTPGLEFKPYASCAGTHTTIEAVKQIKQHWLMHHKSTKQLILSIDKIEFIFPPHADLAMPIQQPSTKFEGRFSLEYVTAVTLLKDDLSPLDFIEQPVTTEEIRLMAKMKRCPDLQAEDDSVNPANRFNAVKIYLNNGQQLHSRITRQELLQTKLDLQEKLKQCLVGLNPQAFTACIEPLKLNVVADLYAIRQSFEH